MEKTCPKCGTVAIGKKYISKVFGFRKRPSGLINPQSNCKECRKKNAQLMSKRAKKKPLIAKLDMRTKKAKQKIKIEYKVSN